MEIAEALKFVAGNHHAVLATARRDGRPQMSPVAVGVETDGMLAISSRETAMKTKNVRRDPQVSVCVFTDAFYGQWVQVDGTAEVVSLPAPIASRNDGSDPGPADPSGITPSTIRYLSSGTSIRAGCVRGVVSDIAQGGPAADSIT